jgi:periplasmic protein TonB
MSADESPSSGGIIGGVLSSKPQQSNSALPQRVRVSQGVSTGLLVTKVPPQYPDDARQARIQGTVVLKALLDTNGDVEDLTLVSGHPLLAPAALEAVKQWKYKPYLLNGQPVKVETQITVNFQLAAH